MHLSTTKEEMRVMAGVMREDIIVFLILMLSWSSWFWWWTFSSLPAAALWPICSFLFIFGLVNPCSAHSFCFLILISQETRSVWRRKSAATPWTESGFRLPSRCYFLLLHCYSLGAGPVTPPTAFSQLEVVFTFWPLGTSLSLQLVNPVRAFSRL